MRIVVLICRILVGVLFIVSGMIKANDPMGFAFKLQEYFEVFGTEFLKPLAVFLAITICVVEVVLGVATLTGSKMKAVTWSLLLMIVFFTFLTFYSAYYNKVTDCGCFGEALKALIGRSLTPWESFTKDIGLLILIIPMFVARKSIQSSLSPKGDIAVISITTILVTWFSIHCLRHLPVVDFSPYAVGKNLPEQMKVPEGAPVDVFETILFYEKDGVEKAFTMQNYPWQDSTWVWKKTETKLVKAGFKPPIHDFRIVNADGVDYTEDVLTNPDYNFLLVERSVKDANKKIQPMINDFANKCAKRNINFIALSASGYEEIDAFRHENQTMYDFYSVDDTQLKTVVRSNPGLVLLKAGTVIDMWHYNDFPTFEEFENKYLKGQK